MSIFDEIERDAETGTPGPWQVDGTRHTGDLKMGPNARLHFVGPDDDGVAAVFFDMKTGVGFTDARRIARVPDLERIALAVNELAEVAYLALSLIDQDNLEAKAGWDALDIAATTALTAFREATQ